MALSKNDSVRENLGFPDARSLLEFGLTADSWPLKKPWPEVQQFELRDGQQKGLWRKGDECREVPPNGLICPPCLPAEQITLPWMETAWGTLRLHALTYAGMRKFGRYRIDIVFHWSCVRSHPDDAEFAADILMELMPMLMIELVNDDWSKLSSGSAKFEGSPKRVQKKFAKFCRFVASGEMDNWFSRAEARLEARWLREREDAEKRAARRKAMMSDELPCLAF